MSTYGGGGGGRFSRMPASRWSGGGGGGRHHPYRDPQDHPSGGAPSFRMAPGRAFQGFGRVYADGSSFAKLFIGAVPRTATEEDIRPLFEEHGDVIEVAFIKDRRTGQQQSCCFVKYAALDDAERAIRALHDQYTLPGAFGPIQVRYADGEQERLGAIEYRLYVAGLHGEATEREIEEIFSPYGIIEDIFILRDDMRQSRGRCFVKLANREMALGAINALNGTYTMRGCDQPLIVRFAEPRKPRPGEFSFRGNSSSVGPCSHAMLGPRQPNHSENVDGQMPWNASCQFSPYSQGPSSCSSSQGFGNNLVPRDDFMASTSAEADIACIPADQTDCSQSSPKAVQLLSQHVPIGQLQNLPSVESLSSNQGLPSQGERPRTLSSIQQNPSDDGNKSLQEQDVPTLRRATSPLTKEVFQQQSQTLPMRSEMQSASVAPWAPAPVMPTATLESVSRAAINIACKWSEHTCPDGFKYYYNCITRESRWEKPEEFAAFEQEKCPRSWKQQNLAAKWLHSPSKTHSSSCSQSPQTCRPQSQHVHPQVWNRE